MRTVFLGTSDFAAAVLERLAGSQHRPMLVVTGPVMVQTTARSFLEREHGEWEAQIDRSQRS